MIPFNVAPYLGTEFTYIKDAIDRKHICGDGEYTKRCNALLEKQTGAKKALLTHSCTAALEMSALLLGIQPGDEVICPSFTFVTTASAFALRGATIVFVDIRDDTLNINETKIEAAITEKTKAIVVVHYAGVGAEMDAILEIAQRYGIPVVEDAAQGVGAFYKGKPLGSMGDIGCFSFHETKNISCGEGGAILINNEKYIEQAEIVREKGTNRSKFFRGQVDKYTWVALGSSYLPSDMIAAYLYPQLERMAEINGIRKGLWARYDRAFAGLEEKGIRRPFHPEHCDHNAHMYYLRFSNLAKRTHFITYMREHGVCCVFHYIPLHSSPAGKEYGRAANEMPITDTVSDELVRLPLFYTMSKEDQNTVIEKTYDFVKTIEK